MYKPTKQDWTNFLIWFHKTYRNGTRIIEYDPGFNFVTWKENQIDMGETHA